MTTIVRTAHNSTIADTTTPPPVRGPIARVVLGSLLTGLAGAAALTLVAFPGGPEHVITGSALLAFAAGWAMLAVLSARLTSQPQRWAFVPAVVMAFTGLGLLAFAPGTTALTHAGWVWPPVMFALAGWMGVQLRRALTGRVRWLLYPVIGTLALTSVGGFTETVALHHDRASMAMPGKSYDVGGHRLHLRCTGTGSPTVMLESGLGEMSSNWAWIAPAVATTTRVCAYDRAGQGWSDDAAHPQDGLAIGRDLHTLLAVAGERAPFVLVGHSTGGTYAMTYAAQYPSQIAGMVLLDSSTPNQFRLPGYASTYAMMRRGLGVAPSLARLGIGRLVPEKAMSSLPSPAAAEVRAFATSSRGLRNQRDELSTLVVADRPVHVGRRPPNSPVSYTSGEVAALDRYRQKVEAVGPRAESYDLFRCHAWDDRRETATELHDLLEAQDVSVWFSERDIILGQPFMREIDKGLAKTRIGVGLITPAFLKRIESGGVSEKELSELLARDLLIRVAHGVTYDEIRAISPLLGSRNGLSTDEGSLEDIAKKIAALVAL